MLSAKLKTWKKIRTQKKKKHNKALYSNQGILLFSQIKDLHFNALLRETLHFKIQFLVLNMRFSVEHQHTHKNNQFYFAPLKTQCKICCCFAHIQNIGLVCCISPRKICCCLQERQFLSQIRFYDILLSLPDKTGLYMSQRMLNYSCQIWTHWVCCIQIRCAVCFEQLFISPSYIFSLGGNCSTDHK